MWCKFSITCSSGDEPQVTEKVVNMLSTSHEICVRYMTPLGIHHIMAANHHFGPGPWVSKMSRADWTSVYYHKADEKGIGFDRTKSGSDALEQYHPEFSKKLYDVKQCPPEFLLWFHHAAWDYQLPTGRSLWETLCRQYHQGASEVSQLKKNWLSLQPLIDQERFQQVNMHLDIQEKEAKWWRDACLTYFQSFSKMAIPADLEQPAFDLAYYQSLSYPYSPGIRPRW